MVYKPELKINIYIITYLIRYTLLFKSLSEKILNMKSCTMISV